MHCSFTVLSLAAVLALAQGFAQVQQVCNCQKQLVQQPTFVQRIVQRAPSTLIYEQPQPALVQSLYAAKRFDPLTVDTGCVQTSNIVVKRPSPLVISAPAITTSRLVMAAPPLVYTNGVRYNPSIISNAGCASNLIL